MAGITIAVIAAAAPDDVIAACESPSNAALSGNGLIDLAYTPVSSAHVALSDGERCGVIASSGGSLISGTGTPAPAARSCSVLTPAVSAVYAPGAVAGRLA